jgi:hypothetical protein
MFMRCVLAGFVVLFGGAATEAQSRWDKVPATLENMWKSAEAPAYKQASAHDPKFDDKSVWPTLSGKEYFLKAQWPKTRLYVWAHPGQSGSKRVKNALDPTDPINWLVDGKPATELVLDDQADMLLPASEKPYTVGFRDTSVRETLRHLTVESGAEFRGGGDGAGRRFYGNVWVKKGGKIYAQGSTAFAGAQHTFLRNDNAVPVAELNSSVNTSSQYFRFNKEDASVELLGVVSVLDEFFIANKATCIVGVDSIMHPGRSASPTIYKGGKLVLLDGAYWGKWINEFHRAIDLRVEGTVQGGLPERPLTRSATIGLSYRNWQKLDFSKWSGDPKEGMRDVRLVSAMFMPGSEVKTISSGPAKAHLVITWTGVQNTNVVGDPAGKAGDKLGGKFTDAEFAKLYNSIPRKITAFFDSGVSVDGVMFDNVHPGGLLVRDAATRQAWKNVQFGPGNTGKPDELFQVESGFVAKNGTY